MIAEVRKGRPQRIVGLFPQLLEIGGIQEAGRLTVLALQKIASKWGWCTKFLSLNDARGLQVLRVSETEVPFRGFRRSKTEFTWAALQLGRNRTEIVVAAHPHLAVPGAQMKVLNPRLKMITVAHGIEVWRPLRWARRIAFRQSDLLLSPSRYTAEKVAQEQGIPESRIRRVPWPLNPEILRMAEHPGSIPLPPGFPSGLVVLTVARLAASEQYKGVDKLIKAVARTRTEISNVHLVVVGGGDDLARHISLAASLQVTEAVHFFDKLSRDQIFGCYLYSDIFAMPSTGEGFGLVFLEAMAFGKPLIGALAGGIPDVIEDGVNGFVVRPGDLEQLCQALTVLLKNEQLRTECGAKGAEAVRTKFAFDKFCIELESILRECGLDSQSE